MNFTAIKKHLVKFIGVCLLLDALLLLPSTVRAQLISDVRPWFSIKDLTYENPGCANMWSNEKLDHWLKNNESWIPRKNEMPYLLEKRPPRWLTDEDYEQVEVKGLRDGIGKGGLGVFSSTNMDQVVRENQITWLDINDDGKCDFIGWDFSYTGISARGEQGHTVYYIFLQGEDGFKLVDYTEMGFDRWGNGQIPDAILPIWIKGEQRPFLVARSDLYFVSGASVVVSNKLDGSGIYYRSALRWNVAKKTWDRYGYKENPRIAYLITDFIKNNPPKIYQKSCIETPVECAAPR